MIARRYIVYLLSIDRVDEVFHCAEVNEICDEILECSAAIVRDNI